MKPFLTKKPAPVALPSSWGSPPAVSDPLTARTLELQATAGPLVTFLAPVRIPDGPVLIEGLGATDWVVLDTRLDTHLARRSLGIPRGPRRHLERIAASGASFDALFIGHELPAGTVSRAKADGKADDLETLLGASPVDRGAAKGVTVLRAALDSLKATAVVVGKGATAAAAVAGGVLDGLDPVVLGAVTADGKAKPGDRAALFYLAHWT